MGYGQVVSRTPVLMVIFGAGASADICDPGVTHNLDPNFIPPLARDIFADRPNFVQALLAYPDAEPVISRLRRALLRGDDVDIELELEAMRGEAKLNPRIMRHLTAFRFYLRQIIWQCSNVTAQAAGRATNYSELMRRIETWRLSSPPGTEVLMVTFNYDPLLEWGCAAPTGLKILKLSDYVQESFPYKIIKVHGSCDWGRYQGELKPEYDDRHIERLFLDASNSIDEDSPEASYEYLGQPAVCAGTAMYYPALALPLENKSQFACPNSHLQVMQPMLPRVQRILVIGWRAAEAHFLSAFNGKIQRTIPMMVVGHGRADETAKRMREGWAIPDSAPTPTLSNDGFSGFLRTNELEDFLAVESN